MRNLLFCFLLTPLLLSAQKPDASVLSTAVAKSNHIRNVTITTLFLADKDSLKQDTAIVQSEHYDRNGSILFKTYLMRLDQSHYYTRSDFSYSANGNIRSIVTIDDSGLIDSVVFLNSSDHSRYNFNNGKQIIHEIKGDTIETEIVIDGKDTIRRPSKELSPETTHWDLEYSGNYATRSISMDSANHRAICDYYDSNGSLIISVRDNFDTQWRVIRTAYFNQRDRNFKIFSARYNADMNLVYIMKTKKRSACTFVITTTYNDQGLLVERKYSGTKRRNPPVLIKYTYDFYN